jgi:RHS repeat-associated protein
MSPGRVWPGRGVWWSRGSGLAESLLTYVGLSTQVASEEDSVDGTPVGKKTYSYDAFGQRIGLTAKPSAGNAQHYTYGYDPHGSVSLLVADDGSVTASYGYTAYGATDPALTDGPGTAAQPLNPYRYEGKRLDSGSGTLDMGARRYSPTDGRFLQQDLYFGSLADLSLSTDPLTGNRYALAGGNPLGFIEFDGHRPEGDPGDFILWSIDGGAHMSVSVTGASGQTSTTSNETIVAAAQDVVDAELFFGTTSSPFTSGVSSLIPGSFLLAEAVADRTCAGAGGHLNCDSIEATDDLDWVLGGFGTKRLAEEGFERVGAKKAARWVIDLFGHKGENKAAQVVANKVAGDAAADAIAARYPGARREVTFGTEIGARRVDVLTRTGLAIESKVGRTSLTSEIQTQIAKDILLRQGGDVRKVEWVFSRSKTGVGPTAQLARALDEAGISWHVER